MQKARHLTPVEQTELESYPISHAERLDSHYFVEWQFNRVLNSRLRLLADLDVRAIAYELMWVSQNQSPVGTLPDDERELAALAGVSEGEWRSLASRDIGPLYNWRLYACDNGQNRLGHPVVCEMAQKAIGLKVKNAQDREAGRARKRLMALPNQIVRAGGRASMAENETYLTRLDQFILENFPSRNRTPAVVREAMEALDAVDARH